MNRVKKIGIISVPIIIAGASVIAFFAVSKKDNPPSKTKESLPTNTYDSNQNAEDIYKDVNIFPKVDTYNFYTYLRMSEASTIPKINNEMIAFMAKYIIHNMNKSGGTTSWGYKRISESEVDIQILWSHIYHNKKFEYHHTYSFKATNNI